MVRIIGIILSSIFFLILLTIALLPTIVSTQKGQKVLIDTINRSICGTLSIERLSIHWLGPQEIENVQIIDETGENIFCLKSFKSSASLFSWLFKRSIGKTELIEPKIFLKQNKEGELNLDRLLNGKKAKGQETKKKRDWQKKGELIIHSGSLFFKSEQLDLIEMSHIEINLRSDLARVEASANIQQGTNQGKLIICAHLKNETLQTNVMISQLPTALLDQATQSKFLSQALGPILNLDLTFEQENQRFFLTGKVDSQNLKGTLLGHTNISHIGETNFYFDPASQLTFTFTPAFFDQLFRSSNWKLANRAEINFSIKELNLEQFKSKKEDRTIANKKFCLPFFAELYLERAELSHKTLGNLSVNGLKAIFTEENGLAINYSAGLSSKDGPSEIKGKLVCHGDQNWCFSGEYTDLPFALLELFYPVSDFPTKLFGPRFSLVTEGQWLVNQLVELNYLFTTHNFALKGIVRGKDSLFDLTGQGNLLLPQTLHSIVGQTAHVNLLSEISLTDSGFSMPLLSLNLENAEFEAEVHGTLGRRFSAFSYNDVDLIVKGIAKRPRRFFERGNFSAHIDGEKNEITASMELKNGNDSRFNAAGEITLINFISNETLDPAGATARFCGHIKQLPLRLLNEKIKRPSFESLFGKTADLFYRGGYENGLTDISINAESNGFFAHIPVRINSQNEFMLLDKALFEWQLTNERFWALYSDLSSGKTPNYNLAHPATVNLELEEFHIQDLRDLNLATQWYRGRTKGTLKSAPLYFENPHVNLPLTIDKFAINFTANPLAQNVDGTFFANFYAHSIPVGANSLASLAFASSNLVDPQGKWNWPNLGLSIKGHLDLLPVHELTLLVPMTEKLAQKTRASLGNLLNASVNGEFINESGPLTLDVKSSNLKAFLPLHYDRGNITLTETVEMEFSLTDEVSAVFLRELNPILISHAVSMHPMRLFINREGFILPLKNYHIQNVKIDKGVLDLGQIKIAKGGHIQTLMEFLKADKPTSDNLMEAWFTPIFFNLNGGVLSYKRFDVLLGGIVHVALWGGIDLASNQVQMTLGIDPKNLRRRFNIAGLSKKEMFQVKMSGQAEKPTLDWSSAYTRLGILIARTAGGHIGYILGGIIEQFVEAFGEQPSPPPTTTPFPWESNETPTRTMPVENLTHPSASTLGLRKVLEFLIP